MTTGSTVPGILAKHEKVTQACRETHGIPKAFDVAAERLKEEYLANMEYRRESSGELGVTFHLSLSVENT